MVILSAKEIQTVRFYDENAFFWAEKRKKITEPSFWQEEISELKLSEGSLLEIGSGSGRESIELMKMGYQYTGVDASRELLKIAKQNNPQANFVYANCYELPFEPHSFDTVFSGAMLPHVPKDRIQAALNEIKRVMKRGALGFFAMREGSGEKEEQETGRWFSYYTQNEFKGILEASDLNVKKYGKRFSRKDLTWLTFFVKF